MAGNTRFHSKHHAQQHHSVRTSAIDNYPDAATDPIGSPEAPHQGFLFVNGCLNVNNQLAADANYDVFEDQISNLEQYNVFHDALLINSTLSATGDVTIGGNLRVAENLYVDKNVFLSGGDAGVINLGDATVDKIKFNAHVGSDVIPLAHNQYNLGSDVKRWANMYIERLDIDDELLVGGSNCVLKVKGPDQQVLIGTCGDSTDSDTRLHVVGTNTKIQSTLHVTGQTNIDDQLIVQDDVHVPHNKKLIFGNSVGSGDNFITSDGTDTKVSGVSGVSLNTDLLKIVSPVVDTTSQATHVKTDDLKMGPDTSTCLVHMKGDRIGVNTCAPAASVHVDGGVAVTGDSLNVTTVGTTVASTTVDITSTGSTNINAVDQLDVSAKNLNMIGSATTGNGVSVESRGSMVFKSPNNFSIETPQINLSSSNTHVLLPSSADALKFDTNTLVIDAKNNRVGINKSNPQSTLHVGGTSTFDSDVQISSGAFDVTNTSTNITSSSTVDISTNTMVVDATADLSLVTPTVNVDADVIDISTQKTQVKVNNSTQGGLVFTSGNPNWQPGKCLHGQTTVDVVSYQGAGVYVFNDDLNYSSNDPYQLGVGVYTLSQVPSTHPILLEDHDVTKIEITGENSEVGLYGTGYYGDVTITVHENFGTVSYRCSNHNWMGGRNNFTFSSICDPSVSNVGGLPVASVSTSTENDTILGLDATNNRVGVCTTDPDKTLTVQGEMSVTGDLTELISTTVDVASDQTKLQATTEFEIDAPTVDLKQETNMTLKPVKNSLAIGASSFVDANGKIKTFNIDAFNDRVGIGTADPEQSLHVAGSVRVTQDAGAANLVDIDVSGDVDIDATNVVVTSTSSTSLMTGQVGINTLTPDHHLVIYDVDNNTPTFNISSEVATDGFDIQISNLDALLSNNESGQIVFGTNNSRRMTIGANGFVGIGDITSDPTHMLTVETDIKSETLTTTNTTQAGSVIVDDLQSDRIVFKNSTDNKLTTNDALYCNATTGQIGVNTITPDSASSLHISDGDFRITQGFSTSIIGTSHSLSDALVGGTAVGTTFQSAVGEHLVFDLRNDQDTDCVAIRHSSNNSGQVDTVGFLYKPDGSDARVGINTTQNMLGQNALTVDGDTNITGNLTVGGNFLVQGVNANLEIKNLATTDKNLSVNLGGTTNMTINAGLSIIGDGDTEVGYVKVHPTDTSILVAKAPTGDEIAFNIDNDVTLHMDASLDVTGPSIVNQDVSVTGNVTHNSLTLATSAVNGVNINQARADLDQVMQDRILTQLELDTTQVGAGLLDSGEYQPDSTAHYISTATSLSSADEILDQSLKTEELTRIQEDAAIQAELDNSQVGAGLATDGDYVVDTSSRYINNATSLSDADTKLDANIQILDNLIGHGVTPSTNPVNHKLRLDNHDLEDIALHSRIDTSQTRIAFLSGNIDERLDKSIPANRITKTNNNGQVTATSLVNWIAGTSSQIDVTDNGSGGIVLSLPQGNFVHDSSITIGDLTMTSLSGSNTGRITYVDNNGAVNTVNSLTDWIAGTTNQITVTDDNDGTVTLSLPQDIHNTAVPTFNNIKLTSLPNHGDPASSDFDEVVVLKADGTLTSKDLSEKVFGGNAINVHQRGSSVDNSSYNSSVRIDHADTSTQPSEVNSGTQDQENTFRKVIQDVEVDTYGHVTKLVTKDVSYMRVNDANNNNTPGLVPERPTVNPGGRFLNALNAWEPYPDVVGRVKSLHPDLIRNTNINLDEVTFDISNTLTIGSTDDTQTNSENGQGSGQIKIVGSNTVTDINNVQLHLERIRPAIRLTDTSVATNKDFNIQHIGGELRIGTNSAGTQYPAVRIGAGNAANTMFNGQVLGKQVDETAHSPGDESFVGDLLGNATTTSRFRENKTVTFVGDVSGDYTTDFAGNVQCTIEVNSVQNNSVDLGTDTKGQYLTNVVAGNNIEVTQHDGVDGDDQTIGVISTPTFTNVSAQHYATTSDVSLKTNINSIGSALDRIVGLQGVEFNWKSDTSNKQVGLIANQVEQHIPDVVGTDNNGHKNINYNGLISYLVESIKELKQEINNLKGNK